MPDDPITEPVQGGNTEPQGGAGTSETPYSEYLNRIPEEVRPQVEPVFREWDANTTRRFQDSAEYRKQWEPYEQLGVQNLSTDEVQWLMQFRQAALNNPSAVKDWYGEYSKAQGLMDEPATPAPGPTEPVYDEFGIPDQNAQLKALLEQQLSPVQAELQRITAWREQQETQSRIADAERMVQSQKDELKSKHPAEYDDTAIDKLVAQYIETDPQHAVPRAFADWQAIRNQVEKSVLQGKIDAPNAAESGGMANGAPEEIKTLADANRIALERIRQSRTA